MTTTEAAQTQPRHFVPITRARVEECLASAQFWTKRLPSLADDLQAKADAYAIAAAVLSALTGLGVWATLSARAEWWAQGTVAAVAFAASIAAVIPRVKNYAEAAGRARELATSYGKLYGELVDLLAWTGPADHDPDVRRVIDEFQQVKGRKEELGAHVREAQRVRDAMKPQEPPGRQLPSGS